MYIMFFLIKNWKLQSYIYWLLTTQILLLSEYIDSLLPSFLIMQPQLEYDIYFSGIGNKCHLLNNDSALCMHISFSFPARLHLQSSLASGLAGAVAASNKLS